MGLENVAKIDSNSSPAPAKTPLEAIENDREFKAHIYQQLVELQPYLSPESQIAVLVQLEENGEPDGAEYALSLVTTIGDYRLEVEGRDRDLYGAFGAAKEKLVHQLDEVYGAAIDSREREAEIQSILRGGRTVH